MEKWRHALIDQRRLLPVFALLSIGTPTLYLAGENLPKAPDVQPIQAQIDFSQRIKTIQGDVFRDQTTGLTVFVKGERIDRFHAKLDHQVFIRYPNQRVAQQLEEDWFGKGVNKPKEWNENDWYEGRGQIRLADGSYLSGNGDRLLLEAGGGGDVLLRRVSDLKEANKIENEVEFVPLQKKTEWVNLYTNINFGDVAVKYVEARTPNTFTPHIYIRKPKEERFNEVRIDTKRKGKESFALASGKLTFQVPNGEIHTHDDRFVRQKNPDGTSRRYYLFTKVEYARFLVREGIPLSHILRIPDELQSKEIRELQALSSQFPPDARSAFMRAIGDLAYRDARTEKETFGNPKWYISAGDIAYEETAGDDDKSKQWIFIRTDTGVIFYGRRTDVCDSKTNPLPKEKWMSIQGPK